MAFPNYTDTTILNCTEEASSKSGPSKTRGTLMTDRILKNPMRLALGGLWVAVGGGVGGWGGAASMHRCFGAGVSRTTE